MKRFIGALALVIGAIAIGGGGAFAAGHLGADPHGAIATGTGTNTSPSGGIVAFGDSIAAGYGLGPAFGFPDNPHAYAALMADDLGVPYTNEANSGACAAPTDAPDFPAECGAAGQPTVQDQIDAAPSDPNASIVTLTVGADDIAFDKCLKLIFQDGNFDVAGNPCGAPSLRDDIAAFKPALANDINAIEANYPNAEVEVMQYYNPFPPQVSASQSPCRLYYIPTFMDAHRRGNSWFDIGRAFFKHHDQFINEVRSVQNVVSQASRRVIRDLNRAIGDVASANGAVAVPVTFAGHSVCNGTDAWAFAARAHVEFKYLGFKLFDQTLGGRRRCPDPNQGLEWDIRISVNQDWGRFEADGGVNCMPHPNKTGQEVIKTDFLAALR